jgi:hypothetical protein
VVEHLDLEVLKQSAIKARRPAEDWGAFDSLELLRGLGIVRTLLAAPRLLGDMRRARSTGR